MYRRDEEGYLWSTLWRAYACRIRTIVGAIMSRFRSTVEMETGVRESGTGDCSEVSDVGTLGNGFDCEGGRRSWAV